MYVHLGPGLCLNDHDIIGIFNREPPSPRGRREFLKRYARRMGPWSAFRMTCPSVMFWPMPCGHRLSFRSCPARPRSGAPEMSF